MTNALAALKGGELNSAEIKGIKAYIETVVATMDPSGPAWADGWNPKLAAELNGKSLLFHVHSDAKLGDVKGLDPLRAPNAGTT